MWEWWWKMWWEGEYFWCGSPCFEHGKNQLVGSLGDIGLNKGREFFFHFRVTRVDVRKGAGLPPRARTFGVEGEAEWDLLAVLFLGWCAQPVRVKSAVLLIGYFPLVVKARVAVGSSGGVVARGSLVLVFLSVFGAAGFCCSSALRLPAASVLFSPQ